MSSLEQHPLTAPRRGDPHNFLQSRSNWEASVFDDAEYFAASSIRPQREYLKFTTFAEALNFACDKSNFCIYAITASGRSTLLDRVKWDEWLIRANGEV